MLRLIYIACIKCGMIGNFVRDCTVCTMDPADDITSPVVGKMQTIVETNFLETYRVLRLLLKELLNQIAAKKAYKMIQKTVPHTTTTVVGYQSRGFCIKNGCSKNCNIYITKH